MKRTRKHPQTVMMKTVVEFAQERTQTSSAFSIIKSDPASSPELLEYAWVKDARAALRVAPPDYANLHRAFEQFKLDPDDPWSWRTMAEYMSLIISVPARKRGRPVEWTPERLMELREERESGSLKTLPDSKAAKRLAKTRAGTTRKSGVEGLRKQIRKAGSIGTK
jgi:hypothetical protein